MDGLHGHCAAQGLCGAHVVVAVAAEEGPVDMEARPALHLGEPARVARVVDSEAVEGDEVADALAPGMVLVAGGKDADLDRPDRKGITFGYGLGAGEGKRPGRSSHDGAGLSGHELHGIVVAMAMGDEDEVSGLGVVPWRIGIDIDDETLAGAYLDRGAAIISQGGPAGLRRGRGWRRGRRDGQPDGKDGERKSPLHEVHGSCLLAVQVYILLLPGGPLQVRNDIWKSGRHFRPNGVSRTDTRP